MYGRTVLPLCPFSKKPSGSLPPSVLPVESPELRLLKAHSTEELHHLPVSVSPALSAEEAAHHDEHEHAAAHDQAETRDA